jgi:hypothetical protein
VRFLATGMMAGSWAEHVAMEMATGEGFVLAAFYAMIDTLDHPEAVDIMKRAVRQEEGHVDFGEQQTIKLIERDPGLRRELLGLSLVWMWGVQRLAGFMQKRLPAQPVLSRLPEFLALALRCNEIRLQRMGVLQGPLGALSPMQKSALVAEAYARKGGATARKLANAVSLRGKKRLTETYLNDPAVRALVLDAERAQAHSVAE